MKKIASTKDFGTLDWVATKNQTRLSAYYGSYEDWAKIPTKWEDVEIIKFNKDSSDAENYKLDHGYDESKPYESASVGGGRIISATLGVNYAFNKYAQVMLHYTYSNLDKDALPGDSNFHQVQARVQFTF